MSPAQKTSHKLVKTIQNDQFHAWAGAAARAAHAPVGLPMRELRSVGSRGALKNVEHHGAKPDLKQSLHITSTFKTLCF